MLFVLQAHPRHALGKTPERLRFQFQARFCAKFTSAAWALRMRLEATPKLLDKLEHPERQEEA